MATQSPQISIRPATSSDLRAMVEIFHAAFGADPVFGLMYRDADHEEVVEWDVKGYEREFGTVGRRFFVAVEGSGEIIAFAKWHFPYTLTPEQAAAGVGVGRLPPSWPAGSQVGLCNEFIGALYAARREHLKHEDMYLMNILAVHPSHQRRGIGALLLNAGLSLADRDSARTYIEASKKGLGLYVRHGWVECGKVSVDLRPYGGEEVESTVLMFREPRGLKN